MPHGSMLPGGGGRPTPQETYMVTFEVTINGQVACTAGVGEFGHLLATLMWCRQDPAIRPKDMAAEEWDEEEVIVSVNGSDLRPENLGEMLYWLKGHHVSVGDEITIRVLDRPNW